MGKPRVRGQHNQVYIQSREGVNILVGEITKMSVKELGELKKNRGLGEAKITSNKTFEGYDLSFEGGVVDWKLASLLHQQDLAVYGDANAVGSRSPYFQVVQTITYFGGKKTVDTYSEVTMHGYNTDVDSMDESTQKWEGFCGVAKVRAYNGIASDVTTSNVLINDMITKTIDKLDASSN